VRHHRDARMVQVQPRGDLAVCHNVDVSHLDIVREATIEKQVSDDGSYDARIRPTSSMIKGNCAH
jgi:hypothetical protein